MSFPITPCEVCVELKQGEIEEGFFHCRVCAKSYCSEHLCIHLEKSYYDEDNSRAVSEILERQIQESPEENGESSGQDFRYKMGDFLDIRGLTEIELRAKLKECLKIAKTIQKELERRMIECSGFIPSVNRSYNHSGSKSRKRRTRAKIAAEEQQAVNKALTKLKDLSKSELERYFRRLGIK